MLVADTNSCRIYLDTLVNSVLCDDNELFKFYVYDSLEQIQFDVYNREIIQKQFIDSGKIYKMQDAFIYRKTYRFP